MVSGLVFLLLCYSFGLDLSIRWLQSLLFSFLESFLISQPIMVSSPWFFSQFLTYNDVFALVSSGYLVALHRFKKTRATSFNQPGKTCCLNVKSWRISVHGRPIIYAICPHQRSTESPENPPSNSVTPYSILPARDQLTILHCAPTKGSYSEHQLHKLDTALMMTFSWTIDTIIGNQALRNRR